MLKDIPPHFRNEEAKVKSRLICSECRANPEPATLKTYFCALGSNDTFEGICDSCYLETNNKCQCPDRGCLTAFQNSVRFARDFYYVVCAHCNTQWAENFTLTSYLPLCNNCCQSYALHEELSKLSYLNIEERFFELLLSCKPHLPKDRMKFIIWSSSQSCKAMLESCRFLSQVMSNLFCVNHPSKIAEFLTQDLKPQCRLCTVPSNAYPIKNFKQVASDSINFLRIETSKVEPSCLSQYLIKVLKINGTIEVNNKTNFNLMVLEGMDLIRKVNFNVVRCVSCVKKICFGWKKGIKLNCGHVMCYKCLTSGVFIECPLDMKDLEFDEYSDWNFLIIPTCHANHEFDNEDVILKLPCFHHSCQRHLRDSCYFCGFNLQKFKVQPVESDYAKSIIEFLKINCPKHLLKIEYFSISPFNFYCEGCKNCLSSVNQESLMSINDVFYLMIKAFQGIFSKHMKMLTFKNTTYNRINSNLTKIISNIGVKNMNDIYKVICIFNTINFNDCSIKTNQLFFFSKSVNSFIFSKYLFKTTEEFKIVFRFKSKKDLICSGLILGLSFFPYSIPIIPLPLRPKQITYKSFLISNNEEIIKNSFEFYAYKNPDEAIDLNNKINPDFNRQVENYRFKSSIYLESNQVYHEFVIDMNPGYYYVSKGFSNLRVENIEYMDIKKSDYGNGLVLNGSLSSPLFGILASEVSLT